MAARGDRWLGRDMATLAGGLAMGVVASRVFPPMLAAAIVISRTGGSRSAWLRSILRWRVSPVYYAYALGLPVLLAVILNLAMAALAKQWTCPWSSSESRPTCRRSCSPR